MLNPVRTIGRVRRLAAVVALIAVASCSKGIPPIRAIQQGQFDEREARGSMGSVDRDRRRHTKAQSFYLFTS